MHDEERIAELLNTALAGMPQSATHWSVLSTDPFFIEKVRDVVGL